jgi:hypothetical protein
MKGWTLCAVVSAAILLPASANVELVPSSVRIEFQAPPTGYTLVTAAAELDRNGVGANFLAFSPVGGGWLGASVAWGEGLGFEWQSGLGALPVVVLASAQARVRGTTFESTTCSIPIIVPLFFAVALAGCGHSTAAVDGSRVSAGSVVTLDLVGCGGGDCSVNRLGDGTVALQHGLESGNAGACVRVNTIRGGVQRLCVDQSLP